MESLSMTSELLIIGGTGFIGKNLAVDAVESGYKTTVLSLHSPVSENEITGVDYLKADITDLTQLQSTLSSKVFDYVVNLSGYIDHSSFGKGGLQVIKNHFIAVQNLLQSINWPTLQCFVQIGSSDEYGNMAAPQHEGMREKPISPYSFGKVASTQLLQMLHRTEGIHTVILRPFLVYGPGQDSHRFLPQIIQGCLSDACFAASEGRQLRDFCYVKDVTRAILMSLENSKISGEVINIASGRPISIRETVELVQKKIGKGRPDYGKIPYRSGENMELYADISKAEEILGWSPEVSFNEGIERTIEHYVAEKW
jgi:nucleoside-diphosphate-sugar epimerase